MSAQLNTSPYAFNASVVRPAAPASLQHIALAVWNGLTAMGRSRARHELLRQAQLRDSSDPALAQRLREAARHAG